MGFVSRPLSENRGRLGFRTCAFATNREFAIFAKASSLLSVGKSKRLAKPATFPCPYFARPDALAACTSAPRKALHVPVGHKQADRVVQFLLKGRRNRFSMYAACQQYVVVKGGHRPPLIGAEFALVHVGARRDGTFQRIEGFLRLFEGPRPSDLGTRQARRMGGR